MNLTSSYSYNNSYSALLIVRDFHQLPHLNFHLERVSNEFGIKYDDYYNSYTNSLIPLPAIIAGIGKIILLYISKFRIVLIVTFVKYLK
jgi:hypothetical protein